MPLNWNPPRLRTDEDEARERKTSFLELFFDLAIVIAVSRLAHGLVDHTSWGSLGAYSFAFLFLWWAWNGVVYYNERFESDDLSHRLAMFLLVVPIVLMAWAAHDPLGSTAREWVVGYVGVRGILWGLYARAAIHNPPFRPVARVFLGFFGTAQVAMLASLGTSAAVRPWLWTLALALELAAPPLSLGAQLRLPRLSRSHLPERYGLFVIIALGETLVGVINGMDAVHDLRSLTWTVLPLAMWWIYFDGLFQRAVRPSLWAFAGWIYGHAPLLLATVAVGPCITLVARGEPLGRAWLSAAVAAFVIMLVVLRGLTAKGETRGE